MIVGKVSYKYILEKLYRDLGLNEEIPELDCLEWISEALLFIGAFGQFQSSTLILNIEDHRACLPKSFYRLQEITHNNQVMYWAGNSLIRNWCCDECKIPQCTDGNCKNTFYIDDYTLHTSVPEGNICITYLSMDVDDDGFPLVPDDVYYMEACKMYVTKMIDWQLWRKGRIPDKVRDDSEARWNFYVQAARGASNMPSAAELENLKNRLVRLIPEQNAYSQLFNKGKEQKFLK
jgi:hypothetical protein